MATQDEYTTFRILIGPLADSLTADDIDRLITAGEGSIYRGIGLFYLALAGDATVKSKVIKDYDLSVATEKRPEQLRELAASWFSLAERESLLAGDEDIFDSFDSPGSELSTYPPEGSPWPMTF